jgi:hypothetical protein
MEDYRNNAFYVMFLVYHDGESTLQRHVHSKNPTGRARGVFEVFYRLAPDNDA